MIRLNEYINNLLKQYPQLNHEEFIDAIWTFSSVVNIKNKIIDNSVYPAEGLSGDTHKIKFLDSKNKEVGCVSVYKTNTNSTGLRFSIGDATLGLTVTDEGIAQTYTEHPYGEEEHQIVTLGYMVDKLVNLQETLIDTFNTDILDIRKAHTDDVNSLKTRISTVEQALDLINNNNATSEADTAENRLITTMKEYVDKQAIKTVLNAIVSNTYMALAQNNSGSTMSTGTYYSGSQIRTRELDNDGYSEAGNKELDGDWSPITDVGSGHVTIFIKKVS